MTDAAIQERTRSADSDFLSLVYADDQWMRDEFDAIITANWPSASEHRAERQEQGRQEQGRQEKGGGRRRLDASSTPGESRSVGDTGARAAGRQRSPPGAR